MPQANAANRKDVQAAAKAARQAEVASAEVIRSLMTTTIGRAWILTKLESAHIFATSYSPDATQMAFNEGERNQGLLLLNDIMRTCPDEYVLMFRERNAKDLAHERHVASSTASSERSGSENGDGGVGEPSGLGADADSDDASAYH